MLLMHFVNHSKVFFFVFESTLLHQLKTPLIVAFQFMWVFLHSTAKILHWGRPAPHDLPQPCGPTTPSKSILCSQPHPQPIVMLSHFLWDSSVSFSHVTQACTSPFKPIVIWSCTCVTNFVLFDFLSCSYIFLLSFILVCAWAWTPIVNCFCLCCWSFVLWFFLGLLHFVFIYNFAMCFNLDTNCECLCCSSFLFWFSLRLLRFTIMSFYFMFDSHYLWIPFVCVVRISCLDFRFWLLCFFVWCVMLSSVWIWKLEDKCCFAYWLLNWVMMKVKWTFCATIAWY